MSKKKVINLVNCDCFISRDRRPSYTDRILLSSISENLNIVQYSSMNDIKISDHRPVFADIIFTQQLKNNNNNNNIIISSNNTNENPLTKRSNSTHIFKKNPMILIIIITILYLWILLGICYFLIRFQKKR